MIIFIKRKDMAEQMIIRRRLRESSQKMKKQIFPIFPGYDQRLLQISQRVFRDEHQEHGHLTQWLNKVLENLNKISTYINKSYPNTYRFIPYYDPMFIKEEKVPFQSFIKEVVNPNLQGDVVTDAYINKENADLVRSVIQKCKKLLSNIHHNRWTGQEEIPTIQRLKKVVEPKKPKSASSSSARTVFIKPEEPATTGKRARPLSMSLQKSSSKKMKVSTPRTSFIKLEKTIKKEKQQKAKSFVQTTPVPLPYFLVHPRQEFMTHVSQSHKKTM